MGEAEAREDPAVGAQPTRSSSNSLPASAEEREPEALLDEHAARIDRILTSLCRRNAWLGDEAEDFCQWVRLRLWENDFALVRAFRGRSSFATYLTVAIHNLLRDFRNQRLGKWRPTAAARRMGEIGILLDTLLHRDRRSLDEAIEILRHNHGITRSPAALAAMAAELPAHYPRRIEEDQKLDQRVADERSDHRLVEREQARIRRRAQETLEQALAGLEPEERLLLRLRYREGFRVSQIARRLQRDSKALYRVFDKLLVVLRKRLQAAGLTAAAVIDILGEDGGLGDVGQPRSSENGSTP